MLYQIPNWSNENSVLLAEWIFDNYNCEPLELILKTLQNPPDIGVNNWRLTPDTVTKWITVELEKRSIQLEKEHQVMKLEMKEELPQVNYEYYKQRIINGEIPEVKPSRKDDKGYMEFKNDFIQKRAQSSKENSKITNSGEQ